MIKNYFETDKIQTVTLTMETEAGMQWYEERPEKIYKFLGITTGIDRKLKAGWAWQESGERYSTDAIREEKPYLRVDESEMKIYNKASVCIYFSYKHVLSTRFESNKEAQEYVDNLIAESGKKFNVIVQ
jgi:hypothetical protein